MMNGMNEGAGQGSNKKSRAERGITPGRGGSWLGTPRRRARAASLGHPGAPAGGVSGAGAVGSAAQTESRHGRKGLEAEIALGERLKGTRPEAGERLSWRAQFGEAVLECIDGRVVLRGGSMADRLEALEWLALFLPDTVARLER